MQSGALRNQYFKDYGRRLHPVDKGKDKESLIEYSQDFLSKKRFRVIDSNNNKIFKIENTNYININLSLVYDDYDITSLSGVCVAFKQYTKTCIKDYFAKNKIQDKLYIYLPIIANHSLCC